MNAFLSQLLMKPMQYPNRVGFQYIDENKQIHSITFGTFVSDIRRCIGWLGKQENPVAGKCVGIIAGNSYDYLVNLLAMIGSGATAVLLNLENSWKEIQYEIDLSDLAYLVHDGKFSEIEPEFQAYCSNRMLGIDEYRSVNTSCDWANEDDDERIGVILFTSGTTGRGKGVMISLRALLAACNSCKAYLTETVQKNSPRNARFMSCFPFYHVGGITDILPWIMTAYPMVLNGEKRYIFRDLQALNCDYVSLVPTILESIQKYIKRGRYEQIGTVKKFLVSAATCGPELLSFFLDHGFSIYELYGLSENTGIGLENFSLSHYDTVGKPPEGISVSFVDGELCLKGKSMMSGYLKNPEATAEAIQDGWLHTGDLGYMDEEGYVHLTGRKKNLIILSTGENVSPEELEGLLKKDNRILEVVVKGKNRKICAEIFSLNENQEEIRSFITDVNRTLPFFKQITLLEFREEPFPRTASGKIKRI